MHRATRGIVGGGWRGMVVTVDRMLPMSRQQGSVRVSIGILPGDLRKEELGEEMTFDLPFRPSYQTSSRKEGKVSTTILTS